MIAIPNMDKPKSCAECDWIAWSNLEQSDVCDRCEGRPIEDCEKVADFCPLIEIEEPKVGKWIDTGENLHKCTNCGHIIFSQTPYDLEEFHAYCGRCGAKMERRADE